MRGEYGWVLWVLCLVACGPSEKDVTVSGSISYAAYTAGTIEIKLIEDETSDCGLFSCTSQTPGDTVARVRLEKPGSFALSASVQGSRMGLWAYALGSATVTWECEAGAVELLTVDDHRDIALELVAGECPVPE